MSKKYSNYQGIASQGPYYGYTGRTSDARFASHAANGRDTTTFGVYGTTDSKSAAKAQESYDIGFHNTFHDGGNKTRGDNAPAYYQGKAEGGHGGSSSPATAQPRGSK